MQIIVPMSGFGERFRRSGYTVPKPMIEVEGKATIEHVCDLFPGEPDFLFICNQRHLEEPSYRIRETLERCCPAGRVVGIPPHKSGPVGAVLQAADFIQSDQPSIVNYCDFACYWDYAAFKAFVAGSQCDGAVVCYTGFHPHMLGSTNYAYVRERGGWVQDIQEKRPFTDAPMREYASSGTYYFRSGALMLDAFARSMRPDLELNGEYYVSLAYKPLLEDGRRVAVFPVQHFMQWGTPDDLAEYRRFSAMFRRLVDHQQTQPRHAGTVMVPMAGLGSRFAAEGYALPKPLVPVSGRPMVVQATADLPKADRLVFIMPRGLPGRGDVEEALRTNWGGCRIVLLEAPTDGQACTCLLGLEGLDLAAPLTIGACDNGALYDAAAFERLFDDPLNDVIVWVARHHPGAARNPQMYGWVELAGDRVTEVSVKVPLADPANDPIVTGTFTFKRASDFQVAAQRMIAREGRVNGEFYVDTCINDVLAVGLNVRAFEVCDYLCWGTPNDLRRFEYWQSCFHKWAAHPYRLGNDGDVPSDAVATLEARTAPTPTLFPERIP